MKTIKHFISKWLNIGFIQEVENKQRKFGSSDKYYKVTCYKCVGGKKIQIDLLLTDNELKTCIDRASGNPEDFK